MWLGCENGARLKNFYWRKIYLNKKINRFLRKNSIGHKIEKYLKAAPVTLFHYWLFEEIVFSPRSKKILFGGTWFIAFLRHEIFLEDKVVESVLFSLRWISLNQKNCEKKNWQKLQALENLPNSLFCNFQMLTKISWKILR